VFPGCYVTITPEHVDIAIREEADRLKFQDLNRLSEALGTDMINLMKGRHHAGYYYSTWTNQDSYNDPQFLRVYR
jgi:hypothetical protein